MDYSPISDFSSVPHTYHCNETTSFFLLLLLLNDISVLLHIATYTFVLAVCFYVSVPIHFAGRKFSRELKNHHSPKTTHTHTYKPTTTLIWALTFYTTCCIFSFSNIQALSQKERKRERGRNGALFLIYLGQIMYEDGGAFSQYHREREGG